jgi:hypothetical protein
VNNHMLWYTTLLYTFLALNHISMELLYRATGLFALVITRTV